MSGAAHAGAEPVDRRPPRAALVIVLSLAAGVTDAVTFLYLGGVFTSVITGTLVVLGISLAHASEPTVVRALVAVGVYVLGVFAGSRLAALSRSRAGGDRRRRLRAAMTCLTVETVLLSAMWASWLAGYHEPAGHSQIPPLALAGLAMGMQSAAMQALGHPGLATTYLTGATTQLVSGIGGRGWRARFDGIQALALVGVVAGAGVAALLVHHLSWIGPLPAAVLAAASVLLARSQLHADGNAPRGPSRDPDQHA